MFLFAMITTPKTSFEDISAAEQLLKHTGVSILEAASLVYTIHQSQGILPFKTLQTCISRGIEALEHERRTVTFLEAVEECLLAKSHLRPTSLRDIRYITQRMMLRISGLERRKVRSMDSDFCQYIIYKSFETSRQRFKARAILSGIMAYSCKRGWCKDNSVLRIDAPILQEHEIKPLSPDEIEALLHQAGNLFASSCLPAVGLMLYAGIRPHELERLQWRDINLNDSIILIRPTHSKTGGARAVSIQPVLKKLLQGSSPGNAEVFICPPGWKRKWALLHRAAGWDGIHKIWQADCLRHSFASYHASYFRNLSELQMEMGHTTLRLLQYRYLNMNGISPKIAQKFWQGQSEKFNYPTSTGVLPKLEPGE